jgi:hypothetical protein
MDGIDPAADPQPMRIVQGIDDGIDFGIVVDTGGVVHPRH